MSIHETRTALCPYCGHTVDRASNAIGGEGKPKAGDFTVCIRCARVSVFDNDEGGLRMPTLEEHQEINRDPKIQRLCRATVQFNRELGEP